MTPEQLKAGADEARKVANRLDSAVGKMRDIPALADQAIGLSVLAALFGGTARVMNAMAKADEKAGEQ